MSTIAPQARLRAELDTLADAAEAVGFGLPSEPQSGRLARQAHLMGILRRYLEPRLAEPAHPVVVAVFGPTGSGKSTLVNTLVGRPISEAGVLRPTTRRAVVWVHHRSADIVEEMLAASGPVEVVADDHPVLSSIAIVDTPDIDSIAEDHRAQTTAILEAADVAIAVTTPQRYADAVPWDVLGDLTERSLDVMVVMNRATRRASGAVVDLAGLLRDARVRGIDSADDIVVIQEQRVRGDGRLHGYALRRLARRLETIAADHTSVSARGVASSVRHAVAVGRELATAVEDQAAEGASLESVIDEAVAAQRAEIDFRLESGELVRQEVVQRWQRLVGVSDLASLVERSWGKLTDAVFSRRSISEDRVARVDLEVAEELVELGLRRAQQACTSIDLAWSLSRSGSALLEEIAPEWSGIRADLRESIDSWRAEVVALVAEAGRGRYRLTRVAAVGINATATLVLLGVFAATGGLTGAEMGVAAGAAAAQQTLLERLFGSAAANRLARSARSLLSERLTAAVVAATDHHRRVLAAALDDLDDARRLRDACDDVATALEEYAGA
ncbi:MAG TPA: dynamin family protein [Acidimicrobiia bacterium]|nr:dynamin family protein [Acidimicrobiia bacterium]